MKLKTITEDEFEDLDSEDTFQEGWGEIWLAVAVGSHRYINILTLEKQIYETIEDIVAEYGNITKTYDMIRHPPHSPWEYPTIHQKLQPYPIQYLGLIEMNAFQGPQHKDTIELLEQLIETHHINNNTIWVTNADEILKSINRRNQEEILEF